MLEVVSKHLSETNHKKKKSVSEVLNRDISKFMVISWNSIRLCVPERNNELTPKWAEFLGSQCFLPGYEFWSLFTSGAECRGAAVKSWHTFHICTQIPPAAESPCGHAQTVITARATVPLHPTIRRVITYHFTRYITPNWLIYKE